MSTPRAACLAILVLHVLIPAGFAADRTGVAVGWDSLTGRALLGELKCTACHTGDERHADYLLPKESPQLAGVGARVTPQYLRAFLTNPHATKPGTTMPDALFGHRPDGHAIYVLGNETEGVSAAVQELATGSLSIPMVGGVESLNVAVTAALVAYATRLSYLER